MAKRRFTKYPSNYVKANSDTCESAHWEAIAEFSDGTTLEFTKPYTANGNYALEIEEEYNIGCELLEKATNTGKKVVYYTVNFVEDYED